MTRCGAGGGGSPRVGPSGGTDTRTVFGQWEDVLGAGESPPSFTGGGLGRVPAPRLATEMDSGESPQSTGLPESYGARLDRAPQSRRLPVGQVRAVEPRSCAVSGREPRAEWPCAEVGSLFSDPLRHGARSPRGCPCLRACSDLGQRDPGDRSRARWAGRTQSTLRLTDFLHSRLQKRRLLDWSRPAWRRRRPTPGKVRMTRRFGGPSGAASPEPHRGKAVSPQSAATALVANGVSDAGRNTAPDTL